MDNKTRKKLEISPVKPKKRNEIKHDEDENDKNLNNNSSRKSKMSN